MQICNGSLAPCENTLCAINGLLRAWQNKVSFVRTRIKDLPLTTTSVAMDTLSTLVWTAQVYFPACLNWMLRIMMSPADRWNVWKRERRLQKVVNDGYDSAEFRRCRALGGVHRQAQCQNDFCSEWFYYIMEEKGPLQVQGRIKTARRERKKMN